MTDLLVRRSSASAIQVSARVGALILSAAQQAGANVERLVARTGFDPRLLADPDAHFRLDVEEALWDGAAEFTGDTFFGLHAAQALQPGAFSVLDYAVRTTATLREALDRLLRYNRLMHDRAHRRADHRQPLHPRAVTFAHPAPKAKNEFLRVASNVIRPPSATASENN